MREYLIKSVVISQLVLFHFAVFTSWSKGNEVESTKTLKTYGRFANGHTHTCANGHTWDHDANPTHTCTCLVDDGTGDHVVSYRQCGLSQYVQDNRVKYVTVQQWETQFVNSPPKIKGYSTTRQSEPPCVKGYVHRVETKVTETYTPTYQLQATSSGGCAEGNCPTSFYQRNSGGWYPGKLLGR